ncbi:MAG: hypothetical protein V7608_2851, partial [Hyphomicrobiales bacterium]
MRSRHSARRAPSKPRDLTEASRFEVGGLVDSARQPFIDLLPEVGNRLLPGERRLLAGEVRIRLGWRVRHAITVRRREIDRNAQLLERGGGSEQGWEVAGAMHDSDHEDAARYRS